MMVSFHLIILRSAVSNAHGEEAKMSAVGNIGFPPQFRASLDIDGVLKPRRKRSPLSFMAQSTPIRLNHQIYCKLSDSGIEESQTSRTASNSKNRMEEYNMAMKKMMKNPYEYHHDLVYAVGLPRMNYTLITDGLIVGSQPQKPEDIDHLKKEQDVAYILNLQQDRDVEYWRIDSQSIIRRCRELGIRHMRRPAIDFDPNSLRNELPKAVSSLEWAVCEGKGRVYVHCTAGLGRAPAVAIAYLFWFGDVKLNAAYDMLTAKRPCGPNKRAIRGATYDLAKNDPWKEPFESLPEYAFEHVAGWERELIQKRVRSLRGT